MSRFYFGGTNRHLGSWDVYCYDFAKRGNPDGFLGKAKKVRPGVWYAWGDTEAGPFRTRLLAAEALARWAMRKRAQESYDPDSTVNARG